ncbi:hypothetical protein CFP56_018526 [Quercus suber]|uniref:DC1 domain-containing protein n=1 Tax=Quercus suber TaxID=58331 RepID=A0AAW0M125_QUESU
MSSVISTVIMIVCQNMIRIEIEIVEQLNDSLYKIATEIQYFSHEHDLKLLDDDVLNNEKCHGCVQAIFPPFYSCVNYRFFLHESCAKLPRKKETHFINIHSPSFQSHLIGVIHFGVMPISVIAMASSIGVRDVNLILMFHHRLLLSSIESEHNCSCCYSKIFPLFCCTTCEFALDFKCATLTQTARYKQHEHPFTLRYMAKDDYGKYYCDICEKERNSKHWFYYCTNYDYPVHPKCILWKYPTIKFRSAYEFFFHPHPFTFIEKTKDHLKCDSCCHDCIDMFGSFEQNLSWLLWTYSLPFVTPCDPSTASMGIGFFKDI